jgi:hypothetical protein
VMDMQHYLTRVCHYSSYLWVHPLNSKAQTFEELVSLLTQMDKKYRGVDCTAEGNARAGR